MVLHERRDDWHRLHDKPRGEHYRGVERGLDDAVELAAELRELGARHNRPTILGIGLRIEGMALSKRGDFDAALPLLEKAVAVHEQAPLPLEYGRSQLALGDCYRRRNSSLKAGSAYRAALARFNELGAIPFADKATEALARVAGGPVLSGAERQVANLLAQGLSNKDIAEQLVSSVRTIEGHLSRIYRKFEVHSRAELVRRLLDT